MAGNRRSPFGGGPAARFPAGPSPFGDDEKTTVDPAPESWGSAGAPNLPRPAGKNGRAADMDFDTQSATMDELTMEAARKGLAVPQAPPGPSAMAAGSLNVVSGNDRGKTFELTGRRLSIGRGVDNDIVLTDLAVSRQHLAIEFENERYYVRDLGSGNGTLINDVEQRDRSAVFHGDRLEIGNTIIALDLPQHPSPNVGTMDLDENDSSLFSLDEISTVAGRSPKEVREVRRLIGAGVAKARERQAAAGRLPERATVPPQVAQSSGPGLGMSSKVPANAKLPAPVALPGVRPLPTQPPIPATSPPELGPPRPPATVAPDEASFDVAGAISGQNAKAQAASRMPDVRPASEALPTSMPPAPSGPAWTPNSPAGGAWSSPADSLPLPTAQPQPSGYSTGAPAPGDRLPLPAMAPPSFGPASMAPTVDPMPRLAPAGFGQRQRGSRKGLFIAISGASIAIAVIAGVAIAFSGDRQGASESASEVAQGEDGPAAAATKGNDGSDGSDAKKTDEPDPAPASAVAGDAAGPSLAAALPMAAWGTDEAKVVAGFRFEDPEAASANEDASENANEGAADGLDETAEAPDEAASDEAPSEDEPEKVEEVEEPEKVEKREPRRTQPRRSRPRRRVVRRPRRQVVRSEPKRSEVRTSGSTSKDRERAARLYKDKKFAEAATLLRKAADRASGSDARKLEALAAAYARTGSEMAKGDRQIHSDAPAAVEAYSKALSSDARAGKVYANVLRTKIKLYAPKAAQAYMARANFAGAKRMADLASRVGAESRVRAIRSSLESRAAQIIASAKRDAAGGRTQNAAKKYRQVKKMVPSSSKSYRAAQAGLAAL